MVSFSCEVSVLMPRMRCCEELLFDCCWPGMRRRRHQKEARCPSESMPRRLLHLFGLHGPLPRHRVPITHCKTHLIFRCYESVVAHTYSFASALFRPRRISTSPVRTCSDLGPVVHHRRPE